MKDNDLAKVNDITNLKDTLKKYKEAYEKSEKLKKENKKEKNDDDDDDDEDDSITYIDNFNNTLEDFINLFDKDFDNETVLEKLYIYTKELFLSYLETLKLKIDKGKQREIVEKIKNYIKVFINKSSGYLNSLLEILSDMTKKKKFRINFYNIIIFVMEELNKLGKESILSNKKFCKYHSLIYFEQSKSYYDKYLSNIEESLLDKKSLDSLKNQKTICNDFIRDINSGAVVLLDESFKGGYLISEQIISAGTGKTNDLRALSLGNIQNSIERCKIVLANYEKVLSTIQMTNVPSKKEAICIANIMKLNAILGNFQSKYRVLLPLAKRCELIIDREKIDKNEEWYKEFIKLYDDLKKRQTPDDDFQSIFQNIRRSHGNIFDEIDEKFNKSKGKKEFINFILKKHPFKNFEN